MVKCFSKKKNSTVGSNHSWDESYLSGKGHKSGWIITTESDKNTYKYTFWCESITVLNVTHISNGYPVQKFIHISISWDQAIILQVKNHIYIYI